MTGELYLALVPSHGHNCRAVMGDPDIHPDDKARLLIGQDRAVLPVNTGVPFGHINERLVPTRPFITMQSLISPWPQPPPLLLQIAFCLPGHQVFTRPVEKEGRIFPFEAFFVKRIKQVVVIRVKPGITNYQDQGVLPGRHGGQLLKKPGHRF
ncbi:hypothetical protein ES703_31090 [subsurface metagenome]